MFLPLVLALGLSVSGAGAEEQPRAVVDPNTEVAPGAARPDLADPDSLATIVAEPGLPDSLEPDDSLFRFLEIYGRTGRVYESSGQTNPDSVAVSRTRGRGVAADSTSVEVPLPGDGSPVADEPTPGDGSEGKDGLGDDSPLARVTSLADTTVSVSVVRPLPLYELDQESLAQSTDRTLREILPWMSPLRVARSGSPFTSDLMGRGDLPGRESVTVTEGGLPVQPSGAPETAPDTFSPLWLSFVRIRPASPLRLPNNPTGGALLEAELLEADTTSLSAARLSDGSFDSNSNEIYFVRPSGRNTYGLFWSDHKSVGRIDYGSNEGSGLLLRFGRQSPWGRWSLTRQTQFARQRLFGTSGAPDWRWLWDRSSYDGRLESQVGDWQLKLASSVSWQRNEWQANRRAKRKDQTYRSLVWLVGPSRNSWRPRLTLQSDVQRTRFFEAGRLSLDRWHHGVGFAAGVTGTARNWRYEASAGRSDPGLGDAGWIWAVEAEQTRDTGWHWRMDAGRAVRARLIPRLANDYYVAVGQVLTAPELDSNGTSETVESAELSLGRGGLERYLRLSTRAVRVSGAVSSEGALAGWNADGFENQPLPPSAFDEVLTGLSLGIEGRSPLLAGFALEGSGRVRQLEPGWEEQLWGVPAEFRGRLAWSAHLFEDSIWLDLFVRGHGETGLATTLDTLGSVARFDAGGRFQVGTLSGYFVLLNLEGAAQQSATISGGVMSLPLRSYRIGLTWRFVD